jgi:release factor glutamine methyltransferase
VTDPAAEVVARLRAAGCVFAEEEAALLTQAAPDAAALSAMLRRREAGEPLEQILGWAGFRGLRLVVEPGVFVPRARTGLLVEEATAPVRRAATRGVPVVVDLCCGCGAVGAALAHEAGPLELHAVDVDDAAVRCARRNLAGVGRVYRGDLFTALPGTLAGRIDVLVVNAPYVPSDEIALMPPEARLHEPRTALDGGPDGLAVVRRILADVGRWLAADGTFLVETSRRQTPVLVESATRAGLAPRVVSSQELGGTAVVASRA